MGVVYEALQRQMNRTVALKMLKSSLVQASKFSRFRREVQVISALSHPNIVSVYSTGIAGGVPYIAMEFLPGKSMSEVIASQGPQAWEDALPIFMQVCDALGHAHENAIIHSDLKPSNLMVVGEGKQAKAKLVDFGVAKIVSAGKEPSTTSSVGGSYIYMSPEQYRGRGPSAASDIYSLGCTLYETLVGKPPFQRDSIAETALAHQLEKPLPPSALIPAIPEPLDRVIACCLEKECANRYQTAAALRADLQSVLDSQPPQNIPHSQEKSVPRSRARLRLTRMVVVLSALALVAAVLYLHSTGRKSQRTATAELDESACRVQSDRLLLRASSFIVHNDLTRAEQALTEADVYAEPLQDHYFDGWRQWARGSIAIRKSRAIRKSQLQNATAEQTHLRQQASADLAAAATNLELAHLKALNSYQLKKIETLQLYNFRDQYQLAKEVRSPEELAVLSDRLMEFAATASNAPKHDKDFFDTVFEAGLGEYIRSKNTQAAIHLVGARVRACRAQGYSLKEIDFQVELAAKKVEALLADKNAAAEVRLLKSAHQ